MPNEPTLDLRELETSRPLLFHSSRRWTVSHIARLALASIIPFVTERQSCSFDQDDGNVSASAGDFKGLIEFANARMAVRSSDLVSHLLPIWLFSGQGV